MLYCHSMHGCQLILFRKIKDIYPAFYHITDFSKRPLHRICLMATTITVSHLRYS